MKFILDKSFIHATPKDEFLSFLSTNECYLFETTFYELMTTETPKRISAFSKLVNIDSPVRLVNNVGAFLRYEISNKKPCHPVEVLATQKDFSFNSNLIKQDFDMGKDQRSHLTEWIDRTRIEVQSLTELAFTLPKVFPELEGFSVGSKQGLIERIQTDLCEQEFLLKVFSFLAPDSFKNSPNMNLEWASVRWVQIKLISCLEVIRRYGLDFDLGPIFKKIENLFHDFSLLLPSVFLDGLATSDNLLRKVYLLIKPSGKILP